MCHQHYRLGEIKAHEASAKYKLGVYKMASLQGWIVAISGRDLAEEARRLPDSVLSIYDAMDEVRPIAALWHDHAM